MGFFQRRESKPSARKDDLPKGWKIYSGYARVANEMVDSLLSHQVDGSSLLTIKTCDGSQLTVTVAEAEVFAAQYLAEIGYKVKPPR